MKKLTINNKEYNIKYSLRGLFIFEQITGKAFKIETLLDNYIFFYSLILANNKDNPLDWDEFIDALDSNPALMDEINKVLLENDQKSKIFEDTEAEEAGDKKKD